MRLFVDHRAAPWAGLAAALISASALGACGTANGAGASERLAAASAPHGPQGDFPVIVGEPYSIGDVAYVPEDVMNYDQVGFLAADPAGGSGVSGSHHTMPLPSYVEVTSLATGRTILVRIERRGPMDSNDILALSPGGLAQLEASEGTPVRVRRVNPPEDQRALLRAGMAAEPRMDTPMSLVEILKRKLPASGPALAQVAAAPAPPAPVSAPELPPLGSRGEDAVLARAAAPASGPAPTRTSESAFLVQAAAFSSAERAEQAARTLDGEVTRSGIYFRVRTGPFATRGEAEASLAKVRAAGYSDARILTNG